MGWMSALLQPTMPRAAVLIGHVRRSLIGMAACLLGCATAVAADPGRIYVQGNMLMADGSQIYLNGANTPWNQYNEFGGTNPYGARYDRVWWEQEFIRMKNSGINSTRVWIACNGTTQPSIDANGNVTGVSAQFWSDVDHLMGLASTHGIYVMASMMSFDFADPYIWDYATNAHSTKYLAWTSMLKSSAKVQTMIDNYLVPFAVRYKNNPYLYAIDLCNEPEWINQNAGGGSAWVVVSWAELQRFMAMSAAAIHNSGSDVLVTLGSAGAKWNSVIYENNYWSDAALQAQFANSKAFLDFYQIHYYHWMQPWYPLRKSAVELQLADRPLVMGELPGKPTATNGDRLLPVGETIALISEYFLSNGYSGHYPWTSNGVDGNGSLADFGPIALAFKQAHPDLVRTVPSPILSWRLNYFGTTTNTGNAADAFDFDNDGLNNLLEYGLVLSPTTFSRSPSVGIISYPEGNRLQMIVSRDPMRMDVTIEVQANNELSGTWTTIATSALGAPFAGVGYVSGDSPTPGLKTVIIRDTDNVINNPRRFLRLRVTR